MFAAALIVFRESLEASLIISIMMAATRGLPYRGRWIAAGVVVGLLGAALIASAMEFISNLADGVGQELFNAAVLSLAVGMLAWHNIWMSSHGRELATQARHTASQVQQGVRTQSVILLVVALAVLREGAETVLFLFGLASGEPEGWRTTLLGGGAGLAAGALVGGLLYLGLLRIPMRWFFSMISTLVLLLAAGLASQVARYLVQADWLPSLGAPLWDTSMLLSQTSALGTLLHGLVGYDAQPSGMQLLFYLLALTSIALAMRAVKQRQHRQAAV